LTTDKPKSSPEEPLALSERFELGRKGEELAAAYLQQASYILVASNFIVPVGRNSIGTIVNVEIDLVAYDGPTLCFVEVKTRASDWFAVPSANVDARKQRQITRAARAYRRMFGLAGEPYRYDVVSIVLHSAEKDSENLQIDLLRNFWSEEKFRKRRWPERYWD
jgi:putative endonuclease